MRPKRVVYTALLGDYEELIEQHVAIESDVTFICFTDNPDATSRTWDLVTVTPLFPFDLVRSQRELKIRGHAQLEDFDEFLYIDNSVLLRTDPDAILDSWLADGDYAAMPHSFRERVIDEFDEVIALNYDEPGRVNEQLLHYAELYPEVLAQRPFWNGMFAWRNTPEVRAARSLWFDHVLRFSRRDQLSANVSFAVSGLRVNVIPDDNNFSENHQWPVDARRKAQQTLASRRRTGPLLAELARTVRELEKKTSELAQLELVAEDLRRALREMTDSITAERAQHLEARDRLAGIEASKAWRTLDRIRRTTYGLLGRGNARR